MADRFEMIEGALRWLAGTDGNANSEAIEDFRSIRRDFDALQARIERVEAAAREVVAFGADGMGHGRTLHGLIADLAAALSAPIGSTLREQEDALGLPHVGPLDYPTEEEK